MKILFSALGMMCLLFLTIQCQPKTTESSATKISLSTGKYVQGKIVIPANSKHKTGVIRAYIDEEQDPKRLRGLIYQKEENTSFNLYDEVYFQVEELNGLIMAVNVTAEDKSSDLYSGSIAYDMNLHVSHIEDSVHKKVHVVRPNGGGVYGIDATIDGVNLTRITYENLPDPGSSDPVITKQDWVKTSNLTNFDFDQDYYMSIVNVLEGKTVYALSLTHDHIYD